MYLLTLRACWAASLPPPLSALVFRPESLYLPFKTGKQESNDGLYGEKFQNI